MATSFVRHLIFCLQLAHLVKSGLQGYGGTKDEYSRCHGKHFRNGERNEMWVHWRDSDFILKISKIFEFSKFDWLMLLSVKNEPCWSNLECVAVCVGGYSLSSNWISNQLK